MQVALGGYKYRIEQLTHCLPDPYRPGYSADCGPYIQHPVWKADVVATHQYIGVRCDTARVDLVKGFVGLVSLAIPMLGVDEIESGWALQKLAIQVMNADSREGAVAALDAFIEEASMLYTKLLAKYAPAGSLPQAAPVVIGLIDVASDLKSLYESSGCRLLP